MDVDLSTPLSCVDLLLAEFETECVDIAIGSRRAPGSVIAGHQKWMREAMGRVFTMLSSLLVPGIKDFTCGMKAFRTEAGKRLFAAGVVDDWSFDTEILFLARRGGCCIRQVPVEWHDVKGSKVHVLRNAMVSLYQLVAIPLRYWAGGQRCVLKCVSKEQQ
jgi:dolichyl-phosphate beta-glucosyltransferase